MNKSSLSKIISVSWLANSIGLLLYVLIFTENFEGSHGFSIIMFVMNLILIGTIYLVLKLLETKIIIKNSFVDKKLEIIIYFLSLLIGVVGYGIPPIIIWVMISDLVNGNHYI